jgi:hypothetical protein
MKKISTLIYFLGKVKKELMHTSMTDVSCRREENSMKNVQDNYSPPEAAVSAVLNFARSLEVKETRTVGKIEWVLN